MHVLPWSCLQPPLPLSPNFCHTAFSFNSLNKSCSFLRQGLWVYSPLPEIPSPFPMWLYLSHPLKLTLKVHSRSSYPSFILSFSAPHCFFSYTYQTLQLFDLCTCFDPCLPTIKISPMGIILLLYTIASPVPDTEQVLFNICWMNVLT